MNNVIIAFYVSKSVASEYRAGYESIKFAYEEGYDTAVISNIDYNMSVPDLEKEFPSMNFHVVSSPIKNQKMIYRISDFFPQSIWHRRAIKLLSTKSRDLNYLWIQNGAQPWLPLLGYLRLAKTVVWGPIGGGSDFPLSAYKSFSFSVRLREILRITLEQLCLKLKNVSIGKKDKEKLIVLARTPSAKKSIEAGLGIEGIVVCPEVLHPVIAARIERKPASSPKFIWVGQDIPRKNLGLAVKIFRGMKAAYYPDATLDIYGLLENEYRGPNIHFHGWVNKIDWGSYTDEGVMLLTSFREGLPSAVLEAVSNGLLVISTDVGSISKLKADTVKILPKWEYPDVSIATIASLANEVDVHFRKEIVELDEVNYFSRLRKAIAH